MNKKGMESMNLFRNVGFVIMLLGFSFCPLLLKAQVDFSEDGEINKVDVGREFVITLSPGATYSITAKSYEASLWKDFNCQYYASLEYGISRKSSLGIEFFAKNNWIDQLEDYRFHGLGLNFKFYHGLIGNTVIYSTAFGGTAKYFLPDYRRPELFQNGYYFGYGLGCRYYMTNSFGLYSQLGLQVNENIGIDKEPYRYYTFYEPAKFNLRRISCDFRLGIFFSL